MKMMREVAEKEAKEGIRFKIVEMGGRTLKSMLHKSNPTAKPGCTEEDCVGCKDGRGKGGQCHRKNVNYEIECQLCPEKRKAVFIGETSQSLYTRGKQHFNRQQDEDSFMKKHMNECHKDETIQFTARVTNTNKDCLSRQVREGVLIRRSDRPALNSK